MRKFFLVFSIFILIVLITTGIYRKIESFKVVDINNKSKVITIVYDYNILQ